MTKQLRVNVTKQHISNGKRNGAFDCPVALALKDKLPGKFQVNSETLAYRSLHNKKWLLTSITTLPKRVQQFISNFDSGKKVQPFEFKITVRVK